MTSESLFKVSPETKQNIRKCYDLDKPGKMDEAVAILKDWIDTQKHFKKKDFSRNFLEMTIIHCKGSIERAKTRLDKYCTLRTMLPKFFDKTDVKTEFPDIQSADVFPLPKLTEDYYRVTIVKPHRNIKARSVIFLDFYKLLVIISEYHKAHDYTNGSIIIFDYLNINVGDLIAAINPVDLGEALRIYSECYGFRIRSIHYITPSKMIQALVVMVKQILSQKLGDRIHVHKNLDSLYEYVPRELFPQEYGGDEKSVAAVKGNYMDQLASEEHVRYMQEMRGATTDERYRDTYQFNTMYMGLPGTFRSLRVD